MCLLGSSRAGGSTPSLARARRCGGWRRGATIAYGEARRRVSDSATTHNSLKHTGHSSTRRISSKRALRGLRRTRLGDRGRLLKGLLDRLLILGRGRGKTGTTTSLVGHDTTEKVARPVAHLGRLGLGARMRRRCDVGDSLDATRLELMP